MTYRSKINNILKKLMVNDGRVILLGESIRDPYGGAYKVTRGLTKHFNDRIIDLPISEASSIGLCNGLAMGGKIPILEIMFSDFITLCVDQIYNIVKKCHNIHQIHNHIVIRTLYSDDITYGPTHSQNMLHFYKAMGVQYFKADNDLEKIYMEAVYSNSPVSIIEEVKSLYNEEYNEKKTDIF